MSLSHAIRHLLGHLREYLTVLPKEAYTAPVVVLSNATVGQHTRHIIEFFQCLVEQSPQGVVNYELRRRDLDLERDPSSALVALTALEHGMMNGLNHAASGDAMPLQIVAGFGQIAPVLVGTTFGREAAFVIEHTIHHLAFVRVGLAAVAPSVTLPHDFGIAPATIQHRTAKLMKDEEPFLVKSE